MDKNEGKSCFCFSATWWTWQGGGVTAGRSGPFSGFSTVLVIIIGLFSGTKRVGGVPSERIALLHRLGRHAPHRQHVHGRLCAKGYPAGKNPVHTLRVSPRCVSGVAQMKLRTFVWWQCLFWEQMITTVMGLKRWQSIHFCFVQERHSNSSEKSHCCWVQCCKVSDWSLMKTQFQKQFLKSCCRLLCFPLLCVRAASFLSSRLLSRPVCVRGRPPFCPLGYSHFLFVWEDSLLSVQ